jgi:hypothetical protein
MFVPELCPAINRVEEIHGDMTIVTRNLRLAARHRNDIPAPLLQQVRQHVTAGEA